MYKFIGTKKMPNLLIFFQNGLSMVNLFKQLLVTLLNMTLVTSLWTATTVTKKIPVCTCARRRTLKARHPPRAHWSASARPTSIGTLFTQKEKPAWRRFVKVGIKKERWWGFGPVCSWRHCGITHLVTLQIHGVLANFETYFKTRLEDFDFRYSLFLK